MHTKGSCLCGKSTYTLDGEPAMPSLCHCLSCRKLTGSLHSTAIMFPAGSIKMAPSSPLKTVTIPHHELKFPMTVTFCGECGSALYKEADVDAFRGTVIVFAGCFDGPEVLEEIKPVAEMWTKYRVGWAGHLEGQGVRQCVGFE